MIPARKRLHLTETESKMPDASELFTFPVEIWRIIINLLNGYHWMQWSVVSRTSRTFVVGCIERLGLTYEILTKQMLIYIKENPVVPMAWLFGDVGSYGSAEKRHRRILDLVSLRHLDFSFLSNSYVSLYDYPREVATFLLPRIASLRFKTMIQAHALLANLALLAGDQFGLPQLERLDIDQKYVYDEEDERAAAALGRFLRRAPRLSYIGHATPGQLLAIMDQFPQDHFQHLRCLDLSQRLSDDNCMDLVTFLKKYVVPTAAAEAAAATTATTTGHHATSKTTAVAKAAAVHPSSSSSASVSGRPFQLQLCLHWPYYATELARQCMNEVIQILEHDNSRKGPSEEKRIGRLGLEMYGFGDEGRDVILRLLRAHSQFTNIHLSTAHYIVPNDLPIELEDIFSWDYSRLTNLTVSFKSTLRGSPLSCYTISTLRYLYLEVAFIGQRMTTTCLDETTGTPMISHTVVPVLLNMPQLEVLVLRAVGGAISADSSFPKLLELDFGDPSHLDGLVNAVTNTSKQLRRVRSFASNLVVVPSLKKLTVDCRNLKFDNNIDTLIDTLLLQPLKTHRPRLEYLEVVQPALPTKPKRNRIGDRKAFEEIVALREKVKEARKKIRLALTAFLKESSPRCQIKTRTVKVCWWPAD
jgi:hypothetical protein